MPVKDAKLVRMRDLLMGLTGWFSEMGLEKDLPSELDEEIADLLRDLDEDLED